jgi:hypothetical protein
MTAPRRTCALLRGGVSFGFACLLASNSACETFALLTHGSGAAAPTADQCASANEDAQPLRKGGKLRAAKEKLLVCVATSCPAPVRDDCTERLSELEKATPTIVFSVKDAAGADLTAVSVLSDDTMLADHLDGTALAVDPGKHVFTFKVTGGVSVQREWVVREGEKGRRESLVITSSGASSAAPSPPASAGTAVAPAPSDGDKAAARLLGNDGLKLALAGDCAGAIPKLVRAESVVHTPTTAVPLAQCEISVGEIVAGTERLDRVIQETLPTQAPKSWADAKGQAPALLAAAQPRIAKLRIQVEPTGAPPGLQVTVDDQPVSLVLLDNDRPTDPGPHHVVAKAPGFAAAADVTLAEGQSKALVLQLAPLSPVAGSSGSGAAPSPEAPTPTASNRLPAYLSFGVGAAGILVGSVTGILAVAAKGRLNSECSGKVCPPSSQSDIDALNTNAIVSTVGWGVGIAGAAAGVYFWIAGRPGARSTTARVSIHPWLGPGSAGVAGSFQ